MTSTSTFRLKKVDYCRLVKITRRIYIFAWHTGHLARPWIYTTGMKSENMEKNTAKKTLLDLWALYIRYKCRSFLSSIQLILAVKITVIRLVVPQDTTHLMITSWYLCLELCNKTKNNLRLNFVGQADSLKN